jgi:tRNA(fMet)-specific endonuclease VapC
MASYIIKGDPPQARQRLAALPMDSVVVSVGTQASDLVRSTKSGRATQLGQPPKKDSAESDIGTVR